MLSVDYQDPLDVSHNSAVLSTSKNKLKDWNTSQTHYPDDNEKRTRLQTCRWSHPPSYPFLSSKTLNIPEFLLGAFLVNVMNEWTLYRPLNYDFYKGFSALETTYFLWLILWLVTQKTTGCFMNSLWHVYVVKWNCSAGICWMNMLASEC